MKSRIARIGVYIAAGIAALACVGVLALLSRTAPDVELSPSPGFDTGDLSAVEYKGFKKESLFLAMEDGVKLAVDVFLPAGGPEKSRFPVIFEYTPYNRANVYLDMPLLTKILAKWYTGSWGPVFDGSTKKISRMLISRGYAYVIADMRGTGASFGVHIPLDPQVAKDGKIIADWIASRSWCDGNIGMIGQSYHGWSQWAVASQRPKALKCIAPALIMSDTYTGANRPGGITATSWLTLYSDFLIDIQHGVFDPSRPIAVIPCTPVLDEDGDGRLDDEIPLMKKNRPDRFTDDGEPSYADGNPRKDNVYYRAIMEHLKNMRPDTIASNYPYFDDLMPVTRAAIRYRDTSPGNLLKEIRGSGIAVLNIGGWFDGFSKGPAKLHASLQGANPAYLFVGPRFHQPVGKLVEPYVKYLDYKGAWDQQQFIVTLRFFDHYLKGRKNTLDTQNPVYIYVAHEGWRKEREWPLKRQRIIPFYLASVNALSTKPSAEGKDAYAVNLTHSSDYGEPQLNRWVMTKPSRELMTRTGHDRKCYVYETAPLEADLEVTGHPVANLFVSSDRPDADVFAYICDVDERGESVYVTEGQMRAGWHRLYPDDDQVAGGLDVKPDLPWHGYRRGGYDVNPLRGGKKVQMRFDLFPVAWVFRKGHRLRIALAGVDAGNFELNPAMKQGAGKQPTIYFHRGGKAASSIELPVIP